MSHEQLGITGVIHLAVWLVAVATILKGDQSFATKVLWIIVVLAFPCVGLVAWLLLGRKS